MRTHNLKHTIAMALATTALTSTAAFAIVVDNTPCTAETMMPGTMQNGVCVPLFPTGGGTQPPVGGGTAPPPVGDPVTDETAGDTEEGPKIYIASALKDEDSKVLAVGSTAELVSGDGKTIIASFEENGEEKFAVWTYDSESESFKYSGAFALPDLEKDFADYDEDLEYELSLDGMSQDGKVIVGTMTDGIDNPNFAFVLKNGEYTQLKGTSDSQKLVDVEGLSPNGKFKVGIAAASEADVVGVIWNDENAPTVLEGLALSNSENVWFPVDPVAVNDIGTVVGSSEGDDDADGTRAYAVKWTNQEIEKLPDPVGDIAETRANDISNDGSKIVGYFEPVDGNWLPIYWDSEGAHIIETPDGFVEGEALHVSADGSLIVGEGKRETAEIEDNQNFVFSYTEEEGLKELPTLDGYFHSYVYDMNSDGEVVVGRTWDADFDIMRAVVWTKGVANDLANTQTQVVRTSQDQAETVSSFSRFASRFNSRKNRGFRSRSRSSRRSYVSSQGTADLGRVPMTLSVTTAAADGSSGGGTAVAGLSLGITPSETLSFNLDYAMLTEFGSSDSSVTLQDNLQMFSLSVEGGNQFEGLNWGAAIGYGTGALDITRRDDLSNTSVGMGSADLHSTSARFDIGYSTMLGQNVIVTPRLSIAHTRTVRDAYTETQDVLPVSYDKSTSDLTTAAVGVDFYREFSPKLALNLGVGVEFDLSRDATTISGTSDVPGLTDFSVDSGEPVNKERFYASFGGSYLLSDTTSLNFTVSAQQDAFTNKVVPSASLGVQIAF